MNESLLFALVFLAVMIGLALPLLRAQKRQRAWQSWAARNGLVYSPVSKDIVGMLDGMGVRIHAAVEEHPTQRSDSDGRVRTLFTIAELEPRGLPADLRIVNRPPAFLENLVALASMKGELDDPFHRAFTVETGALENYALISDELKQALLATVGSCFVIVENGQVRVLWQGSLEQPDALLQTARSIAGAFASPAIALISQRQA